MKLEHSMHLLCRGKLSDRCQQNVSTHLILVSIQFSSKTLIIPQGAILLNSHNVTMQRCIDNAHRKGQLSSTWYSAVKATKTIPRADGHGLHTVNGKVGGKLDRLFLHAAIETWLKSRWSSPKRKVTNTQSLRILMASGLRLTYMSKLDMHSVSLKVRDIQVWQPSMAPALVPVR